MHRLRAGAKHRAPRCSSQKSTQMIGSKMAHGNAQPLIPDPNFPLIQLPGEYDSHRSTNCLQLSEGEAYNLIDAEGPGCVRHFWITTSGTSALELEIICDGVQQIQMMMPQFFGVLLGKEFYRIESAAINLLPQNGYNSSFPIPFQSSCRISLRNTDPNTASIWSMVNWQKYDSKASLTPYRLHALFSEEKPAAPLGTTLLGAIDGKGFVAGMFHAIVRHDHSDMIWHTGGDTWLIDGETNPHVLRGIGSEDVFGHAGGVYKDLSQWMGGVHVLGEGDDCSEMVAYRFFGMDSVVFRSSMVLRFGTRANDVENVLYYYKAIGTDVVEVESPGTWTLSGPFDVSDYKRFEQTQLPSEVAKGTPGEWDWGNRKLSTVQMEPEHTWVDFARWFRRNEIGNTGTQPDNCAAYASTVIASREERNVILRLGFDDWLKVWLNGEPVSTLQHDTGFKATELPIILKKGNNKLVIRLSNFNNIEWRCWAFSCVIRNA